MTEASVRPLLMDVKQVAAALSLSPRQIQKMVSKGELPRPLKLATSTRWRAADVEAWVCRGCIMEIEES